MKIQILYLVGGNSSCKWTCESQPRACYSRNNCSKVTNGWEAKGNGKENAFRLVGKYSFLSSLLVSLTDGGSYLVYFWGNILDHSYIYISFGPLISFNHLSNTDDHSIEGCTINCTINLLESSFVLWN